MKIVAAVLSFLGQAGDPSSPADGDLWYNTAQKAHRMDTAIGSVGNVGLLYANTADPAALTAAVTTEQTFGSSCPVPANSLAVGKVLRVRAQGVYSTPASGLGTLTLRLKLGSVVLAATPALTLTASQSGKRWRLEATVTVRSLGAAGTADVQGEAMLFNATTHVFGDMSNAAVKTVDTTAQQSLGVSAQFSAGGASETITLKQLQVEVLN